MPHTFPLIVPLDVAADDERLVRYVRERSGLGEDFSAYRVRKRSIDARKRDIKVQLTIEAYARGEAAVEWVHEYPFEAKNVAKATEIVIVGAGPAGLFAALAAIERGLRPIVLERGKDVRARRHDLAALSRDHVVNPESNYCFGEGGAGTYSDGKLYTRSGKRGSIRKVLERFCEHGADADILVDAHPHIGTNKLPGIITAMREMIVECGGEVRFGAKLTKIHYDSSGVTSVEINGDEKLSCRALVLATGHSARDVFRLLHEQGIPIERKTFALGVRVEHPQETIDRIQYHRADRGEYLPPASYSFVEQVAGRGVYSFCMCPGGIIAPCATEPGEIVTNGWSPSKRNNPFANSGIVVPIDDTDLKDFEQHGPLAAMELQSAVERRACEMAGGTQAAPAQRLVDFMKGRVSTTLPECSYHPGVSSVDLKEVLPKFAFGRLREAFRYFGQKAKGYLHPEAILVAPESRTSSPVRIPRDRETMMHQAVPGLFPCGEGAGYAGGIVSAAIDGDNVMEAVDRFLNA
jgi:uncharacterized FAD-dependent dehydrogenase